MNSHPLERYGAENTGRLKKVMLHCPELSLRRINETNYKFYLFDRVPDYDRYMEEHRAYSKLLENNGVEVIELSGLIVNNRVLMTYLPNLAYLNDIAVISEKGAVLSAMCPGGRQYEEIVAGEAIAALGIPHLHKCGPGEQFEGYIALSSESILVGDTERHRKESIERFFSFALEHYREVLYVEIPQARRYMHPDMIFGRISDQLGLFYPPAFLKCWHITKEKRQEIDFKSWMKKRGFKLVSISEEEQKKWGTSFVILEPNHIINYDISLSSETMKALESMGVRFTQFHPEALLAGGGSLRCLTLRLLREQNSR